MIGSLTNLQQILLHAQAHEEGNSFEARILLLDSRNIDAWRLLSCFGQPQPTPFIGSHWHLRTIGAILLCQATMQEPVLTLPHQDGDLWTISCQHIILICLCFLYMLQQCQNHSSLHLIPNSRQLHMKEPNEYNKKQSCICS